MRLVQLANGAGCWDVYFFPRHWVFGFEAGAWSAEKGLWYWKIDLRLGPLQMSAEVSFGQAAEERSDA